MPRASEELDRRFAQVAIDRARVMAPIVLVAIAASLLASEPTNIPISGSIIIVNLADLALVAVLTFALITRRVPERWGHAASAAVWWAPVVTTLTSFHVTHSKLLVLLVLLEMSSGSMLLHAGWLLGSFAVVDTVWIMLNARDPDPNIGFYISTVMTAQVFATVMFVLMRRSLGHAEQSQLAEAATARELAHRLAELERSEDERAKLSDQLQHVQRMEAVGTLAAGLAHDMNNVLAAILGFTEMLLEDATDETAKEDLRQVLHEAERGAELTRGLLAFSRRGQYRKQTLVVTTIVDDVVQLLGRTLPKSIQIKTELAVDGANVDGDPAQLGQVLVNLGLNAADAMSGTGTLLIAGDIIELDDTHAGALAISAGGYTRLRVTDSGVGMDEPTRLRVFEPFFTTKPIGKGTGLGLSLVWGAVQGHGGAVTVDSKPGSGSTFSVYLPISDAAPSEAPTAWGSGRIHRRGTVLVVDDEPAVRASIARMLSRIGLTVLDAANGADGLRVFDEHRRSIGLVILDMGMPVMDGASCFHEIRRRSQVPVLIATGYAADADTQKLVAAGARLLEKPFSLEALSREIEALMGPEFRRAS
ncbi:MAG TPA: response regulator [Kofleriaceae bacterium]|nr:response regulator [Kofleriaceae bacterium]